MSRLLDYRHRIGGHCGSGALRDQLHTAGLGWDGPPSEALVFALGGAVDFVYLRSADLVPPVYLVGRGAEMEVDLPQRLGAVVERLSTDDPVLGWARVKAEIDAGRPAMIWADIGELPYLRVRFRMSRHDVVVIGYDDEAQLAHVVDNDRATVQEVPYDALARARASTSFPEPTQHTLFAIRWPATLPDLRVAAADAFTHAVTAMRTSGRTTIGGAAVSGLAALDAFVEDVASWPDVFAGDELGTVLFALAAFIEKAGTGGGLFRRLLSDGCREIAEQTRDPVTEIAADRIRACADTWSTVAAVATQADLPVRARTERIQLLTGRLAVLERAAVEALDAASRSLDHLLRRELHDATHPVRG